MMLGDAALGVNASKTFLSLSDDEKDRYDDEIYNNVESPYFLPF